MSRTFTKIVCLSFFVSLLLSLIGCGSVFFYPSPKLTLDPSNIMLDYEDVYFDSSDGVRLHGWFLPAETEPLGTLVFLHGNAANISNHLASVYWLPRYGVNVFMFDYRGFGNSEGSPNIAGSIEDAEAAIEEVLSREDVDPEKVALFGQSLGGAFAVYLGANSRSRQYLKAIVVDSAFSSYRKIVREKLSRFWLTTPLKWPMSLLIPASYDPIDYVSAIDPIPLLIIHGDKDEVVPVHHGEALFKKASEPKRLWKVPDSGHIGAFRSPDYRRRFVDYLRAQFSTIMAKPHLSAQGERS